MDTVTPPKLFLFSLDRADVGIIKAGAHHGRT